MNDPLPISSIHSTLRALLAAVDSIACWAAVRALMVRTVSSVKLDGGVAMPGLLGPCESMQQLLEVWHALCCFAGGNPVVRMWHDSKDNRGEREVL